MKRLLPHLVGLSATLLAQACDAPGGSGTASPVRAGPSSAPVPTPVPPQAHVASCTGATVLEPGIPGSPGHLIADERNPNGASELALLMRQLRDDLASVRGRVIAGEAAQIPFEHHRIRCAWPTAPRERDARFDAMAERYLQAVDAFNQGGAEERRSKAAFNGVVQGCVDCHEGSCSGALVAIRPLRIP